MLFLSKETSNKDVNLKTQIMIAVKEDKAESSTEHIWKEKGFFKDQRNDLTIGKANFPENTLVYVNNGSIMPVKGVHAIILNLSYEGKFCQWQIHHQALIWTAMVTIRKNEQYCFVLTNNHYPTFFSVQLLKSIQPF